MSSVQNTKQWTKSRNQVILRPLGKLLSDRFNNFITAELETWKLPEHHNPDRFFTSDVNKET